MLQLKKIKTLFWVQRRDTPTSRVRSLITLLLIITAIIISGCGITNQSVVKMGDQADVHFTCRLKNGEIAISTHEIASKDDTLPKSRIFLSRDRNTPLTLTAGIDHGAPEEIKVRGFEEEVMNLVARTIVGLPVGQTNTLEIQSEKMPEKGKGEHTLQMARVRKRPKEIRLKRQDYESLMNKAPEVGQPYVVDPAIPGKVASVTEEEVVVRFNAAQGTKVDTFFGEGTINELPDKFEIVIDARPGSLVRNVGYVGRIVTVENDLVTMDFSHPFGGETLSCDVLVESVSPASTQAALQSKELTTRETESVNPTTSHGEKQNITKTGLTLTKWIEEHDTGLALAKEKAMPAVLVLYADWCGWCKKLINESFQASSVQELEERIALVKVNSDKQKDLQVKYGQKGFPLVVFFDRKGKVVRRIDGYVDATTLQKALDELLKG